MQVQSTTSTGPERPPYFYNIATAVISWKVTKNKSSTGILSHHQVAAIHDFRCNSDVESSQSKKFKDSRHASQSRASVQNAESPVSLCGAHASAAGPTSTQRHQRQCWAKAPMKLARMNLTIKLDGNWQRFSISKHHTSAKRH